MMIVLLVFGPMCNTNVCTLVISRRRRNVYTCKKFQIFRAYKVISCSTTAPFSFQTHRLNHHYHFGGVVSARIPVYDVYE